MHKDSHTKLLHDATAQMAVNAQTYLYVIIPQTISRLIPLSINLITRMIKTTSLILMIGCLLYTSAESKLRYWGITIDKLTREQEKYLGSWEV